MDWTVQVYGGKGGQHVTDQEVTVMRKTDDPSLVTHLSSNVSFDQSCVHL